MMSGWLRVSATSTGDGWTSRTPQGCNDFKSLTMNVYLDSRMRQHGDPQQRHDDTCKMNSNLHGLPLIRFLCRYIKSYCYSMIRSYTLQH